MTQKQMEDWLMDEIERLKAHQDLEAQSGSEFTERIVWAKLTQTKRILNTFFPE